MQRLLVWLLLGCWPLGALLAQSNFCSSRVESTDCTLPPKTQCYGPVLSCEVTKRYSQDIVPWLSTDQFSYLSVGGTNCDDTYFFNLKKSSDSFESTLNGERALWNFEDKIAFFKTNQNGNIRMLAFYDEDGDQQATYLFDKSEFFIGAGSGFSYPGNWTRIPSEVRWHPTENSLMYPRQLIDSTAGNATTDGQLVKRPINPATFALGTATPLFTFSGYTISSNAAGYKIAGGDGNDVNGGRFLLSLREISNPTADERFVVYDFAKDSLVQPIIDPVNGTYSEVFYGENDLDSALFDLPLHRFDYATVSASGLLIVGRYTKPSTPGSTSDSTEGIRIFDLSGNVIERVIDTANQVLTDRLMYNGTGHLEVGFFRDGGVIRECVIAKATNGLIDNTEDDEINNFIETNPFLPGSIRKGDIIAIYWEITTNGGELQHKAIAKKILDWDPLANANFSGDQYSIANNVQTTQSSLFSSFTGLGSYPFRALLASKPVHPDSVSTWHRYYGEIIELSLDASDPVPRRILHHRITWEDTARYQPEAYFSRNGDKFFFNSHLGYDTVGGFELEQDLYFVALPLRTCKSVRDGVAPPLRMPASDDLPPSFTLYPNPLHSGGKLWLEADAAPLETASASLRLISLDGRRIGLWQGPVEPGKRIQTLLPEVSAGIYVLELVDHLSNRRLYQEKVLVR
ncbi:MAG: hypothetical protein AAF399_08445 [Bacteroidota bacterium]